MLARCSPAACRVVTQAAAASARCSATLAGGASTNTTATARSAGEPAIRRSSVVEDRLYNVYPAVGSGASVSGGSGSGAKVSRRRPLATLEVGELSVGRVVQLYHPGGVSVDIGADADGFLETEEFRDMLPPRGSPFRPGHRVEVRLLDKDEDVLRRGRFHLTARPGSLERPPRYVASRTADVSLFEGVPREEWLEGEVTLVTDWAVFVKVAAPVSGDPLVGVLPAEELVELLPGDGPIRGHRLKVRVLRVEAENRRLFLTTRPPEGGDEEAAGSTATA